MPSRPYESMNRLPLAKELSAMSDQYQLSVSVCKPPFPSLHQKGRSASDSDRPPPRPALLLYIPLSSRAPHCPSLAAPASLMLGHLRDSDHSGGGPWACRDGPKPGPAPPPGIQAGSHFRLDLPDPEETGFVSCGQSCRPSTSGPAFNIWPDLQHQVHDQVKQHHLGRPASSIDPT